MDIGDYVLERLVSIMNVLPITTAEAKPWIMQKHYARRMPCVQYAFGLFDDCVLVGVVTFGQLASPAPMKGVCGEDWATNVVELNRLCVDHSDGNASSKLIGGALRLLPTPMVVMSYADTAQGHIGYVYQATNWLYTGLSAKASDPVIEGAEGAHNRHNHERSGRIIGRVERPRKHRYVYFCGNRKERKAMRAALRYEVQPYPKGETRRYDASAEFATQPLLLEC